MAITMRMVENAYYDINFDAEVIRFMAVTNHGSFHADIFDTGAKVVRMARARFKQRAAELYSRGVMPCEIDLEEYDG